MKKSLLTLALAGGMFFGLNQIVHSQDKSNTKNNPLLCYFADCIGDQNGKASSKEIDYFDFKMGGRESIYICSPTLKGILGIKGDEAYQSLEDANKYWKENKIDSTMYILEISRYGKVKKVFIHSNENSKGHLIDPKITIGSIEISPKEN